MSAGEIFWGVELSRKGEQETSVVAVGVGVCVVCSTLGEMTRECLVG